MELTNYNGSALSSGNFTHSVTIAEKLSKSELLPPHFRGKPENVLIVLALAQDLDINPVMALQQVSVISGRPCLQATLMIALLQQRGCLKGPLRFERIGEEGRPERGCKAWGIDSQTGERIEGATITMAMAQQEGWTRNSKYKTLPDLMLQWRAASFFIRAYYPQVVMGMHTAEEMEDVNTVAPIRDVTPARERLNTLRQQQVQPVEAPPEEVVEQHDDVVTDMLTIINETSDRETLATLVVQANSIGNEKHKAMVKRGISNRAKELGLVWDNGTFVSGGVVE
jgi:hypothetical protein